MTALLSAAALLAAWASIGIGDAVYNGAYTPAAIALVGTGVGLVALAAALARRPHRLPAAVGPLVGVALLVALVEALVRPAGIYGGGPAFTVSHVLTVVAAAVAAVWFGSGAPAPRLGAAAVIALVSASGVAMIVASPRPAIDVWYLFQATAHGLLHGTNMYNQVATVPGRAPETYAYLPGSVVLLTPFYAVFGDVRYGMVAALAVAAWVVTRMNRTAGPALAAVLLLYPKLMFEVEQSWSEPLLLALIVLTVHLARRGRTGWAVACLGTALASKQQVLLLLPVAAVWPRMGLRRTLVALAGGLAAVAPWIVTAPHAFYRGAIAQSVDILRLRSGTDAGVLSVFTTLKRHHLPHSSLLTASVLVLAVVVVLTWLPRDDRGFCLGATLVFGAYYLTGELGFFNEWSLVAELAVLTLAATPAAVPVPAGTGPPATAGTAAGPPALAAPG